VPKAMLAKNDTIYGIFENNKGKIFFSKKVIQDIKGKFIGSEPFILSYEGFNYKIYGIGGIIILFILVALIISYKKTIKKSSNTKITFNSKTNEFEFKQKKITSFEENEKKILYFLLEHPNEYVSLNTLNELFENAKQTETVTAVIKRRELAVNNLVAKVALITDMPESNLILERKNSEDKRLKDILLLPNLLIEI
jgi:putative lipase involved disintegration of autophagic bodies